MGFKIEKYFTHSQAELLLDIFTKEMNILEKTKWNMEKSGKDTTEITKKINDLRIIKIEMDIWKCQNYKW